MPAKKSNIITTVEQEAEYAMKVWGLLDVSEKIVVITFVFLFLYVIFVNIAAYSSYKKSSDPTVGKSIFWLMVITAVVLVAPVVAHYAGVSTFGVLHVFGMIGTFTFVVGLWLLLETYDKREIENTVYKDPYSMAVYFLLITFSVMYVVGTISRRM